MHNLKLIFAVLLTLFLILFYFGCYIIILILFCIFLIAYIISYRDCKIEYRKFNKRGRK